MSSGRNRDYRKLYSRANISRNAWQPYPPNRPQFLQQRSRRVDEEDNLCPETRLIDSALKVYNSRVDFELAQDSSAVNHKTYQGKAKVVLLRADDIEDSSHVLRTPLRNSEGCSSILSNSGPKVNGISKAEQSRQVAEEDPEGPPTPRVSLFPESKIVLGWKKVFPVGAGMYNLGNTCYLNSTLQALFYIPSFCNWLMNDCEHDENNSCEDLDDNEEKCIICAMSATLKITRAKFGNVVKPFLIYSRLKSICKHMSHGRQEDAHEFLRYLLEKMEQSYLDRYKGKQLDNASKETTPLHRIFGGYMRTEICCLICKGTSTTFQHFQDLLLDIRRYSSLEDALRVFFSRESLEGDDGGGGGDGGGDAYKCSKCQRKGHCIKRNFIQTLPKVLCIQLKRFTAMGGKLVKPVSYPEKLDMAAYLYNKQPGSINSSPCNQRQPPLMYHLTSVVSHCGTSMNSGHYTATAKSPNGTYFEFDDAMVHPVTLHTALGMSAYILMYEMIPSYEEGVQSCTPLKSTSGYFSSSLESSPSVEKIRPFAIPPNRPKLIIGSSPRPVNGVPISATSSTSSIASSVLSNSSASTVLAPTKEREKVFFGIKSPNQTTSNGFSYANQPSRLNGTCISRGLADHNGLSVKKTSPDPKIQHSVSRTSPKVNGFNGSPAKVNRNLQNSNSTWSSSSSKTSSRSIFPFTQIECNRVTHSGMPPSVMRSLVARNGTTHADGNSREVAEKSLNRLSKLGVLVGVNGKGRDGESSNGKVDHLVPYPVLSGESSDEEDERRGKRSRKSSETGLSKPLAPASEMTISGNLTADATAIAVMRGWKVAGSTVSKNSRDSQKTVESRDMDVSNPRKELPKDKVEVSISSVRERTGEGSGVSSVGECKKLRPSEERERRESVDIGMHAVNGDHSEERHSGSSRPSSPCSSTSSQSSDSCSHVHIPSTSIKSILQILDRSSCNLMEEAEGKNSAVSPSKCKVLANGTGSVVAGEGDACQRGKAVVDRESERSPVGGECSSKSFCVVERETSVQSKVEKWLNAYDFDAEKYEFESILTSTPLQSKNKVTFDTDLSPINGSESCLNKNMGEHSDIVNVKNNGIRKNHAGVQRFHCSFLRRKSGSNINIRNSLSFPIDYLDFVDGHISDDSNDLDTVLKVDKTDMWHSTSSSGSIFCNEHTVLPKEPTTEQVTQENKGSCKLSRSSSSSSVWGKVPQRSAASPVPVLGRSDARSLISNPS